MLLSMHVEAMTMYERKNTSTTSTGTIHTEGFINTTIVACGLLYIK